MYFLLTSETLETISIIIESFEVIKIDTPFINGLITLSIILQICHFLLEITASNGMHLIIPLESIYMIFLQEVTDYPVKWYL